MLRLSVIFTVLVVAVIMCQADIEVKPIYYYNPIWWNNNQSVAVGHLSGYTNMTTCTQPGWFFAFAIDTVKANYMVFSQNGTRDNPVCGGEVNYEIVFDGAYVAIDSPNGCAGSYNYNFCKLSFVFPVVYSLSTSFLLRSTFCWSCGRILLDSLSSDVLPEREVWILWRGCSIPR